MGSSTHALRELDGWTDARETVTVPEWVMDVITEDAIPFRVVYGKRLYSGGMVAAMPAVAFYDRRFDFAYAHGQFVSEYALETLLERQRGYGLDLQTGVTDWRIDGTTMHLILTWLAQLTYRIEQF